MSNNNLGVWTDQDCALVLIDYQKEMFDNRAGTRTVPTVEELGGQDPAFVARDTPESVVVSGVIDAEVRRAFMDLPEVFQACVILAGLEGFSYQEIARILGVPRGTVMSRLFRGRRAMRRALVRYGREHGYVRVS